MVYVGVSARYLVNVEALNMAESVGNFVRHKKAPIVVKSDNGYTLRYVPVISGQSIAHGYQELLARIARGMGLPVCPLCEQGVFVKHGGDKIIERLVKDYKASYARRLQELLRDAKKNSARFYESFEKTVTSNCVVEDVGGFLYPGAVPVKRTSRFIAGYMIPALSHVKASGAESQMHVRHDPMGLAAEARAGEEAEQAGQVIYYVEMASALYTVNLALDLDMIGCYTKAEGGWGELEDAAKRREAALRALALLVEGMLWGAKKSRFNPSVELESLVVTVSHPYPFNPNPGHSDQYIAETVKRASGYLEAVRPISSDAFIEIHYYRARDSPASKPESIKGVDTHEASTASEAVLAALKHLDKAGCH